MQLSVSSNSQRAEQNSSWQQKCGSRGSRSNHKPSWSFSQLRLPPCITTLNLYYTFYLGWCKKLGTNAWGGRWEVGVVTWLEILFCSQASWITPLPSSSPTLFQKSKRNLASERSCAEPGSAFFKSTLISLVNLIDALAGALLSDKYWDCPSSLSAFIFWDLHPSLQREELNFHLSKLLTACVIPHPGHVYLTLWSQEEL